MEAAFDQEMEANQQIRQHLQQELGDANISVKEVLRNKVLAEKFKYMKY